jgi:hypothetical protein
MRRGSLSVLAIALGFLGFPAPAWAQGAPTDQDKAAATALFDEAKTLLAAGNVADACRKLEESRRLDPLPGTLLNLAACHEREGLTASAMAEFREARAMAERDHRDDRVKFADEHLKALAPKVSMLVIAVGHDAERNDLTVTLDGIALGRAAWGTRIPVDPGTHVVLATAAGKAPRRLEIRVGPDGDVQTATLQPLDDAPPPLPPPTASVAPVPAVAPAPAPVSPPPAPEVLAPAPSGLSTRRTWAIVSAGVGVLGVGAGTFFGVRALQEHNDPNATCTTSPCTSTSTSLNNQAKFAADASTVSFAVGLVGLGVGAFLWFGDTVAVAPGVGRLDVAGRF